MTDTVSVVAVREYGIVMPNGIVAKLTFAMCDAREEDTVPAQFARQRGAKVYGLITVTGVQGAPRMPLVWAISHDLREVIQKHMQEYFLDMADLAPGLVSLELKPRALH